MQGWTIHPARTVDYGTIDIGACFATGLETRMFAVSSAVSGALSRVGVCVINLLSHFFVLRFVMARTRTRANRQQEALNIYVVVDGLGNC